MSGTLFNEIELKGYLDVRRDGTAEDVAAAVYERWSVSGLARLDGTFVVVVADPKTRTVIAASDIFRQRPLYYTLEGGALTLSDDMVELDPGKRGFDEQSVYNYFHFNSDAIAPETFYRGLQTVPPGRCIVFYAPDAKLETKQYWSPADEAAATRRTDGELIAEFRERLGAAVESRMAPVGSVCLAVSGGLDSSSVAALAATRRPDRPRVFFSIVIRQKDWDESAVQDALIKKLGGETVREVLSPEKLYEHFTQFMSAHAAPVTPTAFGRWFLYRTVRAHGHERILEGWGADQLLGGYAAHEQARIIDLVSRFHLLDAHREARAAGLGGSLLLRGLAETAPAKPLARLLKRIAPARRDMMLAARGCRHAYSRAIEELLADQPLKTYFDRHMYSALMVTGLPFGLRVNDANARAHGVTVGLPFLHPSVVRFAFQLPARLKIAGGHGKIILREALKDILPEAILKRPAKRGLEIPESDWFRGALRPLMEELMDDPGELIDRGAARARVGAFLNGDAPYDPSLWRACNLAYLSRRKIPPSPEARGKGEG